MGPCPSGLKVRRILPEMDLIRCDHSRLTDLARNVQLQAAAKPFAHDLLGATQRDTGQRLQSDRHSSFGRRHQGMAQVFKYARCVPDHGSI